MSGRRHKQLRKMAREQTVGLPDKAYGLRRNVSLRNGKQVEVRPSLVLSPNSTLSAVQRMKRIHMQLVKDGAL